MKGIVGQKTKLPHRKEPPSLIFTIWNQKELFTSDHPLMKEQCRCSRLMSLKQGHAAHWELGVGSSGSSARVKGLPKMNV